MVYYQSDGKGKDSARCLPNGGRGQMAVENYPGCVVHLPAARAAGIFVSAAMGGEGFEFRMGNRALDFFNGNFSCTAAKTPGFS